MHVWLRELKVLLSTSESVLYGRWIQIHFPTGALNDMLVQGKSWNSGRVKTRVTCKHVKLKSLLRYGSKIAEI